MRLTFTPVRNFLAGLTCLAALSLAGCTEKENVNPENTGCGTQVTVRLCHGKTLLCDTEHTTLKLADGTLLRPGGPLWAAYLPKQVDGQVLSVGYKLGAAAAVYEAGSFYAEITCLEAVDRCGTPTPPANKR